MSSFALTRRETQALERLAGHPLPAGEISREVLETLCGHKLALELLGHCTITPRGQLELQRQRFRKAGSQRVARVTRSRFLFLQEAAFAHNAPTRAKLREFVRRRRAGKRTEPLDEPVSVTGPVTKTEADATPVAPAEGAAAAPTEPEGAEIAAPISETGGGEPMAEDAETAPESTEDGDWIGDAARAETTDPVTEAGSESEQADPTSAVAEAESAAESPNGAMPARDPAGTAVGATGDEPTPDTGGGETDESMETIEAEPDKGNREPVLSWSRLVGRRRARETAAS